MKMNPDEIMLCINQYAVALHKMTTQDNRPSLQLIEFMKAKLERCNELVSELSNTLQDTSNGKAHGKQAKQASRQGVRGAGAVIPHS